MTATSDIGPALRAARRRLGLTQQEVADLAGLSDRTVRDLEKGSSSPSLGAVIAVATVLGLRLEVTG
ncbi:helix-turn-helix domain-containing protein [Micrococcus sp.]|uniref:helix-turn-helix domain-containing protein n=1 Tax=Micrococcus sp. TaxID=1271 RepID=UPI0026DB16E4|nr:helix-turn-helix domain-containing protein [Micrococcus sp.]MDO4238801.1 helix-turn-helix domain-containing protein [Micrococcus sp.]